MTKQSNEVTLPNNFEDLRSSFNQGEHPDWWQKIRQANLDKFEELGIPSVKDEEWKYTNIKPLAKQSFNFTAKNELIEREAFDRYCDQDKCRIVFVNGVYSEELTRLNDIPAGIKILTLKDALEQEADQIKELLNKYKSNSATSFVALNAALTNNGIYIKVDANVVCQDLIHIVHVTSATNGETLSLPRSIITMGKSSEATILESHIAFTDEITYFSNALNDIYLAENAVLHYSKAQKESLKAYHIGNSRVWQERNSNLDSISVVCGSSITRNNIDIILDGEGINSTLNGLYSTYGEQHVDNHTSVDHRYPNCVSNQLYKGILNGASRAVFNGKIFVQSEAQQTNSYQLNKNLLLGDKCRVDTKPQLEIFADDVKCTHGATVGQLNEDELFYLQTRCIPRTEATKMLAHGFVNDLVNTVKNKEVVAKLRILLEPSFAQL